MNATEQGSAPYRFERAVVIPTEWARGPWFADQQHGASLLGLIARFMERVPTYAPMRFTRITADLSRPVPLKPMVVEARPLRDGRRVQSLEATVAVDGVVLCRGVATRIRVDPGLVPEALLPASLAEDAAPPFATVETPYELDGPNFTDRLDVRRVDQTLGTRNRTWYRLRGELIEGEEATPTVRLAAIADMVLSSGNQLGPGWVSINPEVSLQIEREPRGGWFCVSATARFGDDGIGASEAVLFDEEGRIGRSSKSILNFRRGGATT